MRCPCWTVSRFSGGRRSTPLCRNLSLLSPAHFWFSYTSVGLCCKQAPVWMISSLLLNFIEVIDAVLYVSQISESDVEERAGGWGAVIGHDDMVTHRQWDAVEELAAATRVSCISVGSLSAHTEISKSRVTFRCALHCMISGQAQISWYSTSAECDSRQGYIATNP